MRKFPLFVAVIIIIAILAIGNVVPVHAQGGGTYVVQPGDTLFSIAARFNVGVSDLATINRIYDVNAVYVGQVLTLPNMLPYGFSPAYPVSTVPQYPATGGPIYYPVPVVYTPPTYPSGTTITTVTTYTSYTVRQGDFLSSIAQRYGTTPDAIMAANAISNPNFIFTGQILTIPRTSTNVVKPYVAKSRPVYNGRVYYVQPGDNLFGIAARYRTNAWSIARANGILDLNRIYVGQPLVIQ
jgi:LysM repeat protein